MNARQRLLLVLWTAGAVSVACNVLAASPTLAGRAVAAWPPIALLLVVEVLTRSPLPRGHLRWTAALGAAAVASVAAVASFHHMHAVALEVGESRIVAWLFPLSVDGLAVVTSVALLGPSHSTAPTARPATPVGPVADDLAPIDPPAAPASLFVPPPLGASSPALNGSGSTQATEPNNLR